MNTEALRQAIARKILSANKTGSYEDWVANVEKGLQEYASALSFSASSGERLTAEASKWFDDEFAANGGYTPSDVKKLSKEQFINFAKFLDKSLESKSIMKEAKQAKRDYSKFYTPDNIADRMVQLLQPKAGQVIIDPHAGDGALIRAIKRGSEPAITVGVEINESCYDSLRKCADIVVIKDFLEVDIAENQPKYSGAIDNPPFGNGIDLKFHIEHLRKIVRKNGKIVIIVPFDFAPSFTHETEYIQNWAANSDGSKTEIKIIHFTNDPQYASQFTASSPNVTSWEKALVSLTPGGSEFAGDPQRCVEFVKEFQDGQHKALIQAKKASSPKGSEGRLTAEEVVKRKWFSFDKRAVVEMEGCDLLELMEVYGAQLTPSPATAEVPADAEWAIGDTFRVNDGRYANVDYTVSAIREDAIEAKESGIWFGKTIITHTAAPEAEVKEDAADRDVSDAEERYMRLSDENSDAPIGNY